MHRQTRQSNRFSSKGDSGSVAEVKNRPESPKLDHERQRTRSASSVSSRSPSPGRRVRPTRTTVRKVERSRSSSLSSSEEESSKKQQRHRTNSSSRSGSRSPNAISPKMPAPRSRRQSDADQAAVRDLSHGGSGDQSAGKNEVASASSRKKWRKKQPQAQESQNTNQRIESATTPASITGQRPNGADTSKGPEEHEQDTREVVSGTMLSTTMPNFAAEKSVASAGKTKEAELSSKQKSDQDERIVEDSSASAKGPQNLSRRSQSRSSSSGSSSAGSRSRSRSTGGKKGTGSGSSSSSSSSSETQSSGSSSDSSMDDSPKKASKAGGDAWTPGGKQSGAQEKVDEADEMEVDSTKNTSLPTRNTGHSDRDNQATVQASGEAKSKGLEEKQNNLEKEQNRSTEAKESHGVAHDWPDDSGSKVADALEKSKDADEDTAARKGIKRRKWNSKASKAAKTGKRTTSMEISTDVLKNLIGDVKLTETVFEMETEVVNMLDYDDQEEDQRDVKVKRAQSPSKEEKPEEEDARRVETRDASPELAEVPSAEPEKKIIKLSSAAPKNAVKTKLKEGKKSKEEKKGDTAEKVKNQVIVAEPETKEKIVATNRAMKSLMPMVDEPEPVTGHQSPALNPPDRVIRIAGLVRPFTVNQLKELLRRFGELDDEYFWISEIKSHCLAAYKTQEQAAAARAALHGTRWPQSNPKILYVDFATIDDVMHRKQEGGVAKPATVRQPPADQQKKIKEPKPKPVEKEEKKHKAKEPKERSRGDREKEERETRDRKREPEKKNVVREWDRDKIKQLSRSRSKSKERDHAVRRSRSRDREQRKRGEYRKEKKEEDRRKEKKPKEAKADEEPPAKLLDDLFRKTKATPCIYWLPLTEEQAQQRMVKRQEEEKERQKRIAAEEKEELKKREAARLERHRERDRAREKSREKDRDRNRQERKTSRSSSRSRSRRRR